MPNGFHGTEEQWRLIESPLRLLDATLEEYAGRYGMSRTRNYHEWPERSLHWGSSIRRLIQIYLADEHSLTFHVWVCAYLDGGSARAWDSRFLARSVPLSEIQANLRGLLDTGRAWAEGRDADNLTYPSTPSTRPRRRGR